MKNRITPFDRLIFRTTAIMSCLTVIIILNMKSKIENKKYFLERIESLERDSIETHELLDHYYQINLLEQND